ncbi:MAG: ATP synthase F1 subunit delta [Prolixibacteraceae bacterium]|nr:ATP synthase F1 subunit delta [Prolixibacteraceae bacterium]
MDRNRVTVRYAKAFAQLAEEQGVLDQIEKDSQMLLYALEKYPGFMNYFLKKGISEREKTETLRKILSSEVNQMTFNFLKLIIDNNRESYIKYILINVIDIIRSKNKVIQARLIVAGEIDQSLLERIKSAFETKLNSTIELKSEINNDLIGGFIFTIDGMQFDASIASRLNLLAKKLESK